MVSVKEIKYKHQDYKCLNRDNECGSYCFVLSETHDYGSCCFVLIEWSQTIMEVTALF